MAKDNTEKAGKARKAGKGTKAAAGDAMTLAAHPRAARGLRLAKGWGGLAGAVLVGLMAARAGLPAFDVALRALVGGVVSLVLCWAVTVSLWRLLVVAEANERKERALRAVERAQEAAQQRAAEQQAA